MPSPKNVKCDSRMLSTLMLIIIIMFAATSCAWGKVLDISPEYQQTPEWCWVTVGDMIFTYFNVAVTNGQCGIVGLFGGPASPCWYNCGSCPFPAGTMGNFEKMLSGYPVAAAQFRHEPPARPLRFQTTQSALTWDELTEEIDNDRPVVTGITPIGAAQRAAPAHVALLIGYEESEDGKFVIINDPFPYEAVHLGPYEFWGGELIQAGQYRIQYTIFKQRLQWRYSLHHLSNLNSVQGGGNSNSGGAAPHWRIELRACTHPAHPNGDLIACTHPAHPNGDLVPCQHVCYNYFGQPFQCHQADVIPCTHPAHPVGDLIPCTHPLHPNGDEVQVPIN